MAAPLTPEDLGRFRWVDHVRLSPGGGRLLYVVSWADVEARQNRAHLVVQDLDPGGGTVHLPSMGSRDHSAEWSPDGTRLAFLSRQGPRDQLFVMTAGGEESEQLSALPDGVLTVRWSPDGRRIAFRALVLSEPDSVIDDPRPPGDDERIRRPPVARIV